MPQGWRSVWVPPVAGGFEHVLAAPASVVLVVAVVSPSLAFSVSDPSGPESVMADRALCDPVTEL